MSESKFKIGDLVVHKTTDKFQMSIISYSVYTSKDRIKGVKIGDKHPNKYVCKYYNPDSMTWEEKIFYDSELELS